MEVSTGSGSDRVAAYAENWDCEDGLPSRYRSRYWPRWSGFWFLWLTPGLIVASRVSRSAVKTS